MVALRWPGWEPLRNKSPNWWPMVFKSSLSVPVPSVWANGYYGNRVKCYSHSKIYKITRLRMWITPVTPVRMIGSLRQVPRDREGSFTGILPFSLSWIRIVTLTALTALTLPVVTLTALTQTLATPNHNQNKRWNKKRNTTIPPARPRDNLKWWICIPAYLHNMIS